MRLVGLKLLLVGAYLLLLVETRYAHRPVLAEYPAAWIPTVVAGVAALLVILSLVQNRTLQIVVSMLLLVTSVAGGYGFWLHTEGELEETGQRIAASFSARSAPEDEGEEDAPPLAPLAFVGLGLLAAVTAWPAKIEKDEE